MKIDIDKIPALLALLGAGDQAEVKPATSHDLTGSYVIVRSRDSGVHAGTLMSVDGRTVVLEDSRRLWYWVAAKEHTLSAVSLHGLGDGCKIASQVERIDVLDAFEIILAISAARTSIEGYKSHDPR